MKRMYVLVIVLSLILVQGAWTGEDTHRELAEKLLLLMDAQKNIEQSFEMVKQMQMTQLKRMKLPGGATDKAQAVQQKIMDFLAKEMSWDKLKDDYISIYAETFTEEELKGLIEFYKSPVGQKFIQKTPELMKRSMEITQKQMADIMPKIREIMKEPLEE